jgi:hypothetical protein
MSGGKREMVRVQWWLLLLLAVGTAGTALHAQEINWQEAVARLARERTLAETCVALLKHMATSQVRPAVR